MTNNSEIAVFGGGCFWCTEAAFEKLRGVEKVTSGYAGGTTPSPTYEQVSSGMSGHAEVVKVEYNPAEISYDDLLSVFFTVHDPTTLNRQGNDSGTQYRSIILYTDEVQKQASEEFIAKLETDKVFSNKIVTEVKPLGEFYEAEEYHKQYYRNNASAAYCQVVIAPKPIKLREKHKELLKKE